MKQYLDNFNLQWEKIPEHWEQGAFNGNGRLGVMVWKDYSGGLRFDMGDTKLYDGRSRVPCGKFVLKPKGSIQEFKMTQHLYTSEINAEIKTDLGTININCFADANHNLVRITAETTDSESVNFSLVPLPAINPNPLRKAINKNLQHCEHHIVNDLTNPKILQIIHNLPIVKNFPKETFSELDGISIRKVPFEHSGGYFLLWAKRSETKNKQELTWSTFIYKNNEEDSVLQKALAEFKNYLDIKENTLKTNHCKAWAEYFDGSFISLPDKQIEAHYWIQIYKIRAASNENEYPIDLMGPWFRSTPWPRIWCNLNVQTTYPVTYQAGKFKVANSLFKNMDDKKQQFINAVPEKYRKDSAAVGRGWSPASGTDFWGEYGNFLWMLFTYERFLQFTQDNDRKTTKYYSLLKRGLNFVIHNLKKDSNGILHFPPDISPEYKLKSGKKDFPDTNYNIAFTQWALNSVLSIAKEINDKDAINKYSKIKEHLVSPQIDKYGYMVAAGIPMDIKHRHFSHLAAFYPTAMLDIDEPQKYSLAESSMKKWLTCPQVIGGFSGYTYTAASIMYSRLHSPQKAFKYIKKYITERSTPNTFYVEAGPCIETPLHAAAATLEMLMTTYNPNEARVFMGIPDSWKDVSFSSLPVLGGHIISAELKNHKITGIKLKSGKDAEISIVFPKSLDSNLKYKTSDNSDIKIEELINGLIKISTHLKQNESLIIGKNLNLTEKIKVSPDKTFHFGS